MTTTAPTTSPIERLEIRYDLDPALSDARRAAEWTEAIPATRAGLAYALDRRDHLALWLRGAYGAATASLWAIMGRGAVQISDESCWPWPDNCITTARADDLLTADGEIDPGAVHDLRGYVWDGSNHVDFVPTRSLRWLSGADRWQRFGHVLALWAEEGYVEDVSIDDGWGVADEYWGGSGNENWTRGVERFDGADDRSDALTAAGIEHEVITLPTDDVLIVARTVDVERAQASLASE